MSQHDGDTSPQRGPESNSSIVEETIPAQVEEQLTSSETVAFPLTTLPEEESTAAIDDDAPTVAGSDLIQKTDDGEDEVVQQLQKVPLHIQYIEFEGEQLSTQTQRPSVAATSLESRSQLSEPTQVADAETFLHYTDPAPCIAYSQEERYGHQHQQPSLEQKPASVTIDIQKLSDSFDLHDLAVEYTKVQSKLFQKAEAQCETAQHNSHLQQRRLTIPKLKQPVTTPSTKPLQATSGSKHGNDEQHKPMMIHALHGYTIDEHTNMRVGQTKFTVYNHSHYRPLADVNYFHSTPPALPQQKQYVGAVTQLEPMCAFIACYNEDADDLRKTLHSLYRQQVDCVKLGYDLHVLVVMDGWQVASSSAKRYISDMFPSNPLSDSDSSEMPTSSSNSVKRAQVVQEPWEVSMLHRVDDSDCATYVLQSVNPYTDEIMPVFIGYTSEGEMAELKVSFLIKRENRRKFNSHEWFLAAFCRTYQPKYLFMGDTGSVLSDKCLYTLLNYMENNDKCSAVAARMRVAPLTNEQWKGCSWRQLLYHAVQSFEYELADNVFTACFSLARHLLVIPGAGGIYRYDSIKTNCIAYYAKATNVDMWTAANDSNPETNPLHGFSPLLIGSLILAEDRILAYGALIKSTVPGSYSAHCSDTYIYMDAEIDYEKFLTQRRRWQNGTIAGLIYVLANCGVLYHLREGADRWRQLLFVMLTACQLILFASTCLSPTYFIFGMRLSIKSMVDAGGYNTPAQENLDYYQMIALVLFLCIFGAFVLFHTFQLNRKVIRWLLDLATVYGTIIVITLVMAICTQLSSNGFNLSFLVCVTTIVMPFVLALFQSIESLGIMLKYFIPFFLFTPTYVIFITYYALTRLWELTWGNRPSTLEPQQMLQCTASMAPESRAALYAGMAAADEKLEKARRERVKVDLIDDSRVVCLLLLLANVAILLGVRSYDNQTWVIIGVMGSAFVGIWLHYVISFLYFLNQRWNHFVNGAPKVLEPVRTIVIPRQIQATFQTFEMRQQQAERHKLAALVSPPHASDKFQPYSYHHQEMVALKRQLQMQPNYSHHHCIAAHSSQNL